MFNQNKTKILSGDVCSFHFYIEDAYRKEVDGEFEDLYHLFKNKQEIIEKDIKAIIHKTFGPEFELQRLSIHRGSVEILLVIGTAYYVVSKYKNFVESIELARSQIKTLLSSEANIKSSSISATWLPGSSLARIDQNLTLNNCYNYQGLLIWYLLITHFILLGFAIFTALFGSFTNIFQ